MTSKVNEYLNTMEVMLAEKSETSYAITASDVEGYAWTLTFTTVDLLGDDLTYTIHYNETVDSEDASRRLVEGVMTMGGNEYALSGTVVTEGETVRTSFTAVNGDDSIAITDLTDDDGQKYRYELVVGGETTETLTMRLSIEDDSLVSTIAEDTDDESYEFRFRRNDDGTGFTITYRYENRTHGCRGRIRRELLGIRLPLCGRRRDRPLSGTFVLPVGKPHRQDP
jgi:hypothetical protein